MCRAYRFRKRHGNDNKACHRLYEDSLEYSTEYVALSAKYSDVKKLHMGKYSMVLELNGADSIMIPLRCFGWNNYKAACEFLRKKLHEQGV